VWQATLRTTLFAAAAFVTLGHAYGRGSGSAELTHAQTTLFSLPMQFEPNGGQTSEQIKFLSRGPGYSLFFASDQVFLSVRSAASAKNAKANPGNHSSRATKGLYLKAEGINHAELGMSLVNANPQPQLEGVDQLPSTVNYFIGRDPKGWHAGIRPFSKVKYHQVYPGIDLVYYGNQRQLEYDFILAGDAQPGRIGIDFKGADGLQIDNEGGLIIQLAGGTMHWAKPVAYQESAAGRKEVACRFALRAAHQAGFELGPYDTTKPLVIDPVLIYSTYLGGSDFDTGEAIAIDSGGNVYITGDTASVNFPTVSGFDSTANGSNDVFVAKLNPTGTALVYSTYLGGSGDDFAHGIAVDASGNAYITGSTESPNFPLMNAAQTTYQGNDDVFVTKLNATGTAILYSTLLGGSDFDSGNAIAVDNSGNAYIAGETDSLIANGPTHAVPFPTANSFQRSAGGGFADAFVTKINTTASGSASLVYSSFLGGTTDEAANAITIDASGNAYVTGQVFDSQTLYPNPPTSDFPTLNAFQPQFNQGSTDPNAGSLDGFLTKINSAGSAMVFSTYLGGFGDDSATDIVLDSAGRIYVAGVTGSTNFPVTLNATQPIIGGGITDFPLDDVFIIVFQSDGRTLYYSTFLGGTLDEVAPSVAVDQFGDIYVAGQTLSYDFPITSGAFQTNSWGSSDGFVAKINPAVPGPAGLVYSSLIGGGDDVGNGDNACAGIVVDTNGNYYVVGRTTAATNFPVTTGVLSMTNKGSSDAFVAKFSSAPDLSVAMTPSIEPVVVGSNLTFTIQINNNGRSTFTGVTNRVALSTNLQLISVSTSVGNFSTNNGTVVFNLGTVTNNASVLQTIMVKALVPGVTTNTATLSSIETGLGLEPNTDNNVDVDISTIQGIADIKLTTMTEAPNPALLTSNLTYSFQIDNKGPYPATLVVLTDALPAGLSFVSATNSAGTFVTTNTGAVVFSFPTIPSGTGASATIVAQAIATGTVINTATVSAFELDTNPGNNTGTTITTVNPVDDVSLSTRVSANTVFAGNNLTYTLFVTNQGPSTGIPVTLTDSLPLSASVVSVLITQGTWAQTNNVVTCSFGSMNTGAVATVTIIVTYSQGGSMTNLVNVSPQATDPNPADNSASIVTTVIPLADLLVTQSVVPNPANVGNNLTYTVSVTNRGPSTATSTVLTDPLPAGLAFVSAQSTAGTCSLANGIVTCNAGDLPVGGKVTMTLTVQATLDGTIVNTASAISSVTDPTTNNNSSISVTVNANPNAPILHITLLSSKVVLSWSTNAVGFALESETAIAVPSAWTAVTNVPVIIGNQYFVTNTATGDSKFYRLAIPQPPPTLSAAAVDGNVVVSWPANATGFILQAKPTLATASAWSPITNTPVTVGNRSYVTNPSSGISGFYQLKK
jgi:uncharacterized repeat protein (TIGR01451 family)